ncbi:hypothetical protein Clacol_001158 [Clathrus columnatus]|uniref:Uncharacterized protein n=1 Tax=Clathrus columnatus TaxID=1419009 RepID=A0AAV4ZXQ9_9AGAM|nr:hypothetical protein Clacol_001158 [Clathrus columnatus]
MDLNSFTLPLMFPLWHFGPLATWKTTPENKSSCQSSKGLIYLTTSRNLHHLSKPHTTISPQPPETQTMFSFNVTPQNISTNSRSSSSYTSRFHYQPPPDLETDDQVPTTRPTTPLPSPIEDLETEVHVYRSSSSQLPIDPDTLWPQYLLMSKDVSTRSKISDLGLPKTIKYGDAISIKGFEGQYHINHYFTVSRCTPPYQIIRIIATTSLGITFEHIGFDVPYECVLPYSSLPYHSRYIFIPFEEVFFTPPCLYPEDHFYSSFPAPTPLPMPPINKDPSLVYDNNSGLCLDLGFYDEVILSMMTSYGLYVPVQAPIHESILTL